MPYGNLRNFIYSCSVVTPSTVNCWVCRSPLPNRRRKKYCSDACSLLYAQNHVWSCARWAALLRDKWRCVTCGAKDKKVNGKYWSLEVNHIVPREGKGMTAGCHHHLDNLQTLCHTCHVKVTNQQSQARRDRFAKWLPSL